MRPSKEETIRKLINHQIFSINKPKYVDPHVKENVLLQAYFTRHFIAENLALDQREFLLSSSRLLQAMVDVISSNGWLNLALATMELTRMVTQGLSEHDFSYCNFQFLKRNLPKVLGKSR